jgi:hypothetical protein
MTGYRVRPQTRHFPIDMGCGNGSYGSIGGAGIYGGDCSQVVIGSCNGVLPTLISIYLFKLERVTGVGPVSLVWKTKAQPLYQTRKDVFGAACENRTRV